MTKKMIKEWLAENIPYYFWRTIGRLIPKYHDRSIFTKFFWRTFWDRRTKGFDETCTWSLDYHLAKLIVPRLDMFLEVGADFGFPMKLEEEIRKDYIARGCAFDTEKHRFVDKDVEKQFYKECTTHWKYLITVMSYGLQDIIDEEDNWEEWVHYYDDNIKMLNLALNTAKTESQKKKYWDAQGFDREYYKGIHPTNTDYSQKLRKHALSLFAKHFQDLWW